MSMFLATIALLLLGLGLSGTLLSVFGWREVMNPWLEERIARTHIRTGKLLAWLAAGILACAVITVGQTVRFMLVAQPGIGTVIEVATKTDSEGYDSAIPTYVYVDYQGVKHASSPTMATSGNEFRVGDKIQIIYRSDDPSRALINRYEYVWGNESALAVCGSVLLLVSLLNYFWPQIVPLCGMFPMAERERKRIGWVKVVYGTWMAFRRMPESLRFATGAVIAFACLLPCLLISIALDVLAGPSHDTVAEWFGFFAAWICLCALAYGLVRARRWVRPLGVLCGLALFALGEHGFWLWDMLMFLFTVGLPFWKLYMDAEVKAYFGMTSVPAPATI